MIKAREFWIDDITGHKCGPWHEVTTGQIDWPYCDEVIHVREVLKTDKTPEQVIKAVCEFLRSLEDQEPLVCTAASLIEANMDKILKSGL